MLLNTHQMRFCLRLCMRRDWLVLVVECDAWDSRASARRQIDPEEKTVVARCSLQPNALLRDNLNILVNDWRVWELKLRQISERFLVHSLIG